MECFKTSLCAAFSLAVSTFAGPITTVPWNGHPGAATFTFDDGLHSQTNNLTFLDNMDVKVTFFVCTGTMDFSTNSQPHLNYAKKGHEIGNHTVNHKNLTQGADLNSEIGGAATKLRSMGLEATSLATPYCAQNATVKNAINQEHFINRGCGGGGLTGWDNEPDWMQIDSHYWQASSNVASFKSSLDQAASGKWHVQLNHGVAGNWDVISTADIKTLIEYAVSKNLWVATFSTVGAYLRAHFTIDKATATNTANGFTVKWTSPHAHMPKSVPLRVKIQGAQGKTVSQKGKEVKPNSDGTYTIEFMALELEVSGEPIEVKPFKGAIEIPGTVEAENYDTYAYSDADGKSDETGYRSDDAGIVKGGSGYALGYTSADDYFEYTLDVKKAGKYKVVINGATGNSTASSVTVSVGDKKIETEIPSKGDWNTYSEVEAGELELAAGKRTLRLTINTNYINIDWIKFVDESGTTNIARKIAFEHGPAMVRYQVFDLNGQLIKSANVMAGSVSEAWNLVKTGLRKGAYVMRYSEAGQGSHVVKVRLQ
ncbi:Carbohydrate binding family 6 [Fibrobacter succinogenes subsp. succinogenes S85]|uniref:Carbohydrate binding family 6 n=1 Tax=Fibrobacter succinogenes (strain ATCC 19169 / S85) TaxID=59374 RepID=A0ABM5LK73_FIBSS|nr:carbohydrate-binding protein [Fibrobacter succinogenes]ACX76071.1 Carbohydrate binding family 6 [Fibrobacter succinogenes subsp. succinogenes S85]